MWLCQFCKWLVPGKSNLGHTKSHRHKLCFVVKQSKAAALFLPLRSASSPWSDGGNISYLLAICYQLHPRFLSDSSSTILCCPWYWDPMQILQLICSLLVNSTLFPSHLFVSGGIDSSGCHKQHQPEPSPPLGVLQGHAPPSCAYSEELLLYSDIIS